MDRTDTKIDTPETQASSLDVPAIVHALTALRTRHGAESQVGHRCSNIMEQLAELETYTRPAWAADERQTLQWQIRQQISELAALT